MCLTIVHSYLDESLNEGHLSRQARVQEYQPAPICTKPRTISRTIPTRTIPSTTAERLVSLFARAQ
eukprot:m.33611 g.33611  ORF g.33611 m.33611 type:complete len:66 (+) comp9648_c0_seq1:649-846(+)